MSAESAREQGAPQGPAVLIVDDDQDMLSLLEAWLGKSGYAVRTAGSGRDALGQIAASKPALVITDLVMAGMDGMTLLKEIHRDSPLLPVVILSGQAGIPEAVQATHLGSAAFLTKPIEKETLLEHVAALTGRSRRSGERSDFGRELVFRSAAMIELMDQAELVADSDITVFIHGDTGTGKEALAKAIHDASPRREAPFIAVNCGAIPEQLLESELFGHEKGAFTGASSRHEGLFKAADGGTLFLDEIGDMPLGLQVKLLRVLQDFAVRPVGSTQTTPVNVRVISATHNDLDAAVAAGEFREDLYYRLNVVPLQLPGLAARREDVPPLVEHFLQVQAARSGKGRKRFSPEAMDYLVAAPWPGNVRQLINVVEHCTALTKGDIIPLTMAQKALRDEPGGLQTLKEAKDAFERKYLVSVLRTTNGNVANAARIAGRNRTEFYKLLSQHELDPASFRSRDS